MKRITSFCLAAILSALTGIATAQVVLTQRTIAHDAALEAAQSAIDTCRKNSWKVTVTVLDSSGGTKVVLHDDGARPSTIENSMRKAYTSLTSGRTSGEYGKALVANPQAIGLLQLDRITTLEGALPIKAGNDIVGSIGVSGAPGGDKDAICAQAGIDRIAKGLN